ncbi:hypothetical protein VP1G_08577 [Cytospora mali]|uniref:DUF1275 domain protein n=1 Tax=Cytospora mali TaxID=578113 RepID=A0A194VBM2_CYTMA|nr:hypothetical protein VP1G_08577 [Valsa mali var. pyri (nom. inval.)]
MSPSDSATTLQGRDENKGSVPQASSTSKEIASSSPQSQPLQTQQTFFSSAKSHLLASVRPSAFAEIELLLLTFCTGLQDAISFPDYHCFASNQTGNTVFLAVGIVIPEFNGDMFFTPNIGVVQSRSLRMTEISTAMATAAWVDLLIDPHLFTVKEKNRPRNRRFFFLITLLAGSLAGAGIYKNAGSDVAIFVSAGGKALVTCMYFFNGSEQEKVEEEAV